MTLNVLNTLEINDIHQLDQFRSKWWELLAGTPNATFFQTLEWLEVYWEYFGNDQLLRVLVVGDPEQPIGILPLVVRSEQRRIGKVQVLTYPLDDWGSFYGPVSDHPRQTLLAGLNHIKHSDQTWELVDVRGVPSEDIDPAVTSEVMQLAGFQTRPSVRAESAVINVSGTWEEYFSQRTSKWRNNYRRWFRRLHEAGTVRYERYRPLGEKHSDIDPRWDLYDTCEELAAASWQGSSTDGTTLSHESIRDFLRAAHEVACRLGCADVNLLYSNDQPIAFAYNYVLNGNVFGLRIGYDPEISKLSPGNLIYALAIEDSFKRGDLVFDLGPGSLEGKRYFCSNFEPIWQYTHYRPQAVRAQLLKLRDQFQDWWNATKMMPQGTNQSKTLQVLP